jgi:hypothetical protein
MIETLYLVDGSGEVQKTIDFSKVRNKMRVWTIGYEFKPNIGFEHRVFLINLAGNLFPICAYDGKCLWDLLSVHPLFKELLQKLDDLLIVVKVWSPTGARLETEDIRISGTTAVFNKQPTNSPKAPPVELVLCSQD